jgi:multicomponent K+:H+ antiporter subunit C
MELLFALALGVLVTCSTYLLLRAHTFPVIVGLTMLSYAVNLFLFGMARLRGSAPVVGGAEPLTDPVPQALVLTAIVIGFAMTAFALVLALRGHGQLGHDRTRLNRPPRWRGAEAAPQRGSDVPPTVDGSEMRE